MSEVDLSGSKPETNKHEAGKTLKAGQGKFKLRRFSSKGNQVLPERDLQQPWAREGMSCSFKLQIQTLAHTFRMLI